MSLKSCRAELSCLLLLVVCVSGCEPGPVTAKDFYLLALKELNANNASLALEHCNTAIELQPDSYEAYSVRCLVHTALGKTTESEADWQKAFDLAPDEDAREDLTRDRDRKNKAKNSPAATADTEVKKTEEPETEAEGSEAEETKTEESQNEES